MTTPPTTATRRRRLRAAAILAAAGIASLVAAASNCTSGSSGISASSDGGQLESSSDARSDGQSDALPSDAGAEACAYTPADAAGRDSTWVGWHHVPQLDVCCGVSVPDDLDATVPPLIWDPCDDASDGCFNLRAIPRSPNTNIPSAVVTRNPAGSPWLLNLVQWAPIDTDRSIGDDYAYDLTTGAVVGAWRHDYYSPCHTFDVVLYADVVSLLVRTPDNSLRLASGSPAAVLASPSFQVLPRFEQLYAVQETATSDTLFAFDIVPSSNVYRTAIGSGAVETTVGKQMGAALLLSFVEGTDVFAYSEHGTVGYAQIYTVAADGTPTLLRGAPDHDVSALATDGTSLVWTETYTPTDGGMPTLQFWTAPYTSDPATLASTARMVTTTQGVTTPFQSLAFGGIYTVYAGGSSQLVVRLADGHLLTLQPPAGYDFWIPTYVSNTELWIGLSITNGPKAVGLRRIPLGSW